MLCLCRFFCILMPEGNPLIGGPALWVIILAVVDWWKQKFACMCCTRYIGIWVIEGNEIDFSVPGDTGLHNFSCSQMLQPAWCERSQTAGNSTKQAGRHWISVTKYPFLPCIFFISKLLCDLIIIDLGPPLSELPCLSLLTLWPFYLSLTRQ